MQAGAIFVDAAAERYLRGTLSGAGLRAADVNEYCKAGVRDFESYAKRLFADESKEYFINFGDSRFNNSSIKTRRGRMELPG